MLREILGKLTGGQVTAIMLAAILGPSAVGAAVTFQPVTIVDPNTGSKSYVDPGRKLWVYDAVAGYRNSPANSVDIVVHSSGDACETFYQYTIPSGKALVITAISGYEYQYAAPPYAGFQVYDGAACSGNLVTSHFSSASSTLPAAPLAVDYGSGIVVKAGKTVSVFSRNNGGDTFLHGYLVPAGAVPSAGAMYEPKSITAAEVAARLKRH